MTRLGSYELSTIITGDARELHLGDCLEVMATLPANGVDSCITDPPYGLSFMGKDWDYGVPGVAYWREVLRVLKPGGFLLAFGGTRTSHRLTCAIEDAGFEIRDSIAWVYGQGFPKSHDISKGIDKAAGVGREVICTNPNAAGRTKNKTGGNFGNDHDSDRSLVDVITAPATDLACQWDGYGTALKPAVEIITVAAKPLEEWGEWDIIVANLYKLEAQLWLLSNVSTAEEIFGSSHQGPQEALSIAQWSADDFTSIREDLSGLMDTCRLISAASMCLNTVTSWNNLLGEALTPGNTFTTKTETRATTDWQTLRYCLSELTPLSTIQAAINQPGSWWSALPAANYLNAACVKLKATLELFAAENVIKSWPTPCQGEAGRGAELEPIVVAMKPIASTFATNAEKWGVAGLWIDGGRIETNGENIPHFDTSGGRRKFAERGERHANNHKVETLGYRPPSIGRWPANLILDEHTAVMLDEQSGDRPSGAKKAHHTRHADGGNGVTFQYMPGVLGPLKEADSGGASRFFYVAKASKGERGEGNDHPTVKPLTLMRYLCRLTRPPSGGIVIDPFMGSGTTGIAAVMEGRGFIGIEKHPPYFEIAQNRIGKAQPEPVQEALPL